MAQLSNSLSDDRTLPLSGGPKVNDPVPAAARQDSFVPPAVGRCDDRDALALARQLNGSLTALMLYMGEIKQRSDEIAKTSGERRHVQVVVDNALLQTERLCALVSQISGAHSQFGPLSGAVPAHEPGSAPGLAPARTP